MKNWGELSQADKLDIMRMAVSQGITDLEAIKGVYNKFAEGGDTKEIEGRVLPEVTVTPNNITLLTWRPMIDGDYGWTGHSAITSPAKTFIEDPKWNNLLHGIDAISINHTPSNKNYNLLNNNCSDATRRALEAISDKQISPFLFTTPGDVKDFAEQELGGVTHYRRGRYETTIPVSQAEREIIANGDWYASGGKIHIKPENIYWPGGSLSLPAMPTLPETVLRAAKKARDLYQYSKNYLKHKLNGDDEGEVIVLSNQKVSRIKGDTKNVSSILTNDFLERNNNAVRKKEDFVNTTDTLLGDRKIPLSQISTFYGIEDGKLKAGPLEVFNDTTTVIPNRAKNVGRVKEYHPGKPATKEYKNAVDKAIKEYNEQHGYEPSFMQRIFNKGIPFISEPYPWGVLSNNVGIQRASEIRDNLAKKYSQLGSGEAGYVVTENNDTIKGYNLNAAPKALFANEEGNAVFVANPRQHVEELNSYLRKHPMYPIMVDNGRFSSYLTTIPNVGIYSGVHDPDDMFILGTTKANGGKIHIKPENRGKFTALKKRTGKSASWFKAHGTPAQKKMATFALNARKWKHDEGGLLEKENIYGLGDKLKRAWAGLTYSDSAKENPEFKDAFRAARNNNEEYFKWNGNLYNTTLQPTVYEKQPLDLKDVRKPQLDSIEDTWNYLRSQNISARNAAALMGNIMQESSFNPVAVQNGGDNAVGLYQLHGSRLKDYQNYLKETNKKDSSHSQTDYMLSLVRGERGDSYISEYNRIKDNLDSLKKANKTKEYNEALKYFNSVYGKREKEGRLYPISDLTSAWENENISLEDLTDLFTNTIERAGRPEYAKRQNYARQFYNHFYGIPKVVK